MDKEDRDVSVRSEGKTLHGFDRAVTMATLVRNK